MINASIKHCGSHEADWRTGPDSASLHLRTPCFALDHSGKPGNADGEDTVCQASGESLRDHSLCQHRIPHLGPIVGQVEHTWDCDTSMIKGLCSWPTCAWAHMCNPALCSCSSGFVSYMAKADSYMAYVRTRFGSKGKHARFAPARIALLFSHTSYPEDTMMGGLP